MNDCFKMYKGCSEIRSQSKILKRTLFLDTLYYSQIKGHSFTCNLACSWWRSEHSWHWGTRLSNPLHDIPPPLSTMISGRNSLFSLLNFAKCWIMYNFLKLKTRIQISLAKQGFKNPFSKKNWMPQLFV